jgi:hypothetical protein
VRLSLQTSSILSASACLRLRVFFNTRSTLSHTHYTSRSLRALCDTYHHLY